MIYFCLNKSGILDPILENLYEKYFTSSVIYWDTTAKEKVKQAPFFSDKWLLVINVKDLLDKDNVSVLENRFVDLICEINTNEELIKGHAYSSGVIEDFISKSMNMVNRLLKDWNVTKDEFYKIIENFRSVKVLSSYKVSDNYLRTYIKWWLFTREGNQYGKINENLSFSERWSRASEIDLPSTTRLNLDEVIRHVRSNEGKLLTVLNLVGIDILSFDFVMNIEEYFTPPRYVTINNFPLYLFSSSIRKRKEIFNIVYLYRNNSELLKRSIIEWCDTFEKIYKAFSFGELSAKNKDSWFSNNGYELKINSKFKSDLWWKCVNTISLERVFVIKENLSLNRFKSYKYIVDLCRKELDIKRC